MAEGTKARPVRCPKCDNLLQDLPDHLVYQCGGCGAVLRAKKQPSVIDGLPEKSDEERARGDFEKVESFSDNGRIDLSDNSESDRGSDGVELESWRRKRVLSEKPSTSSSSSSRNGNRELLIDRNGDRGIETMASRYGRMGVEKEAGYGGRYRHRSKSPAENWVVVNDHEMNFNKDELAKACMEKEVGEIKHQSAIASGLRGSRQIPNWLSGEGDGLMAFRRIPRAVVEGVRFSAPPYPDEGPSNHHLGSSHGYGEPIQNQKNLDGFNRVECLEQDRAELLRKLEELNDKLSRSCDVADKPIERFPPDPYAGHETWFQEGFLGSKRVPMQYFTPDKYIPRQPYFNHGHESIALMNRHGVNLQKFAPPMEVPNEVPGYGDLFGPQMHRRASNQPPHHYFQQPSQGYFSGSYVDVESDPIASYPYNTFFHQPACSCLHCYTKQWQVPPQIPPDVFCKRRFPDATSNSTINHLEVPATFGPRGYNSRAFSPPLYSHEPHQFARMPSDLESEVDGLGRGHTQRVGLANRNGRHCCPIAGGAPFMTCYNCFELLQLPKKLVRMEKNQWKVRCRSCSTVISFIVERKSLVVSVPAETKQIPLEVDGAGSGEVVREGPLHSDEYADQGSVNSCSNDYDNSGHFKSTDTENVLLTKCQWLNLSENGKIQDLHSSSSGPSEDDDSSGVITQIEVSNSGELPLKANKTRPLPGSPLQDFFDYSSNNVVGRFEKGNRSQQSDQEEVVQNKGTHNVVGRFEKGNRSQRSDQEEMVQNKGTFKQDSVKDASGATEMEVSFNEYSNTGMSQDSGEVSKEDQPMIRKGHESFFAGLTKKSFRDFSRSDQTMEDDRINVLINGQPIHDHLVKKAEKQAGPIQPGQYWYDFQAGFWGVMGQPCRGIIPPFIEEFNYPMPKNCAGGNTGVFVNGRELNQKDLDLLAGRGLPTARDKFYIVEISGRVLDENSGEELHCLGKLAPTVEKAKHGFGMRVPRVTV